MRIIVSGGRNYNDKRKIYETLDELHKDCGIDLLNHGGAKGVDTICANWAMERNVKVVKHVAHWKNIDTGRVEIGHDRRGNKYNKKAGLNRNISMLKSSKPDLIICFPGGTGTEHMFNSAIKSGVETWKVRIDIGIEIFNIENRTYGEIYQI